jgi:hypothetical protein
VSTGKLIISGGNVRGEIVTLATED